jgi:2-C-methyl-D-erythritol 4-phosphate cytidylyltransferase/2-C-methyl-D-erythritol 2,4-cyclodiphosphate synthase
MAGDPSPPRASAIVLAAGAGRRLGADGPKAFVTIGDRPLLAVAAAAAAASPSVSSVIVTAPAGLEERAAGCVEFLGKPVIVVTGGPTRQASVRAALNALEDGVEIVAVHDAARPFAPPDLFTAVIEAVVAGAAGAIPVIPVADTVKRVRDDVVVGTLDREELALAQTPQAFRVEALRGAHDRADASGLEMTDDAALLELAGGTVLAVPGDAQNFKITTFLDLARAEARIGGPGD